MTTLATSAAALAASAAIAGGSAYAALWPRSQLFGHILIDAPHPHQLALTFDDGPNPALTPQLLDLLATHQVRASFFLIGRYVREQAALTRQIAAGGHLIGNHTMTHPWLAWQSAARIRMEIGDCSKALEDTLGAPVRFFRPPHGARRPYVLRIARDLGLTPVNWNLIVQDWKTPDAAKLLYRIQRGIGRNRRRGRSSNLLLHDGDGSVQSADRSATFDATQRLLTLCAGSSTRFVTPADWL